MPTSAGYPHPQTPTRSIIRTNTNLSDHLPVWPPLASLPLLLHATEKCMSGIPRHERFHPRTSILIACTYLIRFLVTICLLGYPLPRPHIPLAPTFLLLPFPLPPVCIYHRLIATAFVPRSYLCGSTSSIYRRAGFRHLLLTHHSPIAFRPSSATSIDRWLVGPFTPYFLIVIPFLAFTISLWRAAALLAFFSLPSLLSRLPFSIFTLL